jgi:hypothetical protein
MKIIQGDLILEKDTTFEDSIKVEGNILGKDGKRFSLTVHGNITTKNIDAWNITAWNINARHINANNINALNIDAWNITAWNINARNITAGNITAMDITAWNINARNIDARNINARHINAGYIVCESRKKKDPNNKTVAMIFITNRSKLEPKDWGLEA